MTGSPKKSTEIRRRDENLAWAARELRTVDLGDARLDERLVLMVSTMAGHPEATIPEGCGGWAETKAAYRFLANPGVDPERVLDARREATMERVARHDIVLAVQDTTFLSMDGLKVAQGLGPIGQEGSRGVIAHRCLALSTQGTPLGVLGHEVWTRPPEPKRVPEKRRRTIPMAEKESQRWSDMLETSTRGWPQGTRVVAVADREADIFGFLQRALQLRQDVLVRSSHNRKTTDGYAWQQAEKAPLAGTMRVKVPRAGNRPARVAILELRYANLEVKKPDPRAHRRPGPTVALTMIVAEERRAPKGVKRICWRLMTWLPVEGEQDAARCVQWCALRWRIERFFFTLRSGRRIETLRLKTFPRWARALAVLSIVGWRLLALKYAARETPDASGQGFLSEDEWRVAYKVVHRVTPPSDPPSLRDGVRLIARLGGFLVRKGDGEPGVKVLWRGFARLHDLMLGVEYARGFPTRRTTYG